MHVVLRVLLLFFISSSSAHGVELRLDKYQIRTVEISAEARSSIRPPIVRVFDNLLRFEGISEEISLARSATVDPASARATVGFDPDTLSLKWLDTTETLLWASWKTFPSGEGMYTKEGHLVLAFDSERFREIFRDSIYSYGSTGIWESTAVHMDIQFDSPSDLVLRKTEDDRWWSDTKSIFASNDPEVEGKLHHSTTRSIWTYRLREDRLVFLSGERFVDIPNATAVSELARTFGVPERRLRRLNPELKGKSTFFGSLRIDDKLKPYQHERDNGIERQ